MAYKKLYKTAEEIIDGYGLRANRGTRNIRMIGKILASGNVSLMLYNSEGSGQSRVRYRKSLNAVLFPEKTREIKQKNEATVGRLLKTCLETNNTNHQKIMNSDEGEKTDNKQEVMLISYIEHKANEALKETNNRHSMFGMLNSLLQHLRIFGSDIDIRNIDTQWCRDFIKYLKYDSHNLSHSVEKGGSANDSRPRLSVNSQNRLMRNMNYILNCAMANGIIRHNPFSLLKKQDKISYIRGTRTYLDTSEVKKLLDCKCEQRYDIKEAFLFACFTGLRYSDLKKLSWSDINHDNLGTYIQINMTKTKNPIKIYLPKVALEMLPSKNSETTDATIMHLPCNEYANKLLSKWLLDAGIGKKITFHCARHTAATILLSHGIPLAVVSKQLGHFKIATTEVYAKIIDEAQKLAAMKMDELFR